MSAVPFQFLLLGAGEVLKIYSYVTPEKLQTFIMEDETFSIRPPLQDCRLALYLLENVGFLKKQGEEYTRNCD